MVNILSIDVGIKNLSFCLLQVRESLHGHEIEIMKWNVINVNDSVSDPVNKTNTTNKKYECSLKSGCKLTPSYAYVYEKDGKQNTNNAIKYACKRHFKLRSHVEDRCIFENKPNDISKLLKSSTVETMRDFCKKHTASNCDTEKLERIKEIDNLKHKVDLRTRIVDILCSRYVYPIKTCNDFISTFLPENAEKNMCNTLNKKTTGPVSTSASTISLVLVGFNIMNHFDKAFYGTDAIEIDYVIIENQISPIANRMKTVQGMITQYFLMRGVDKNKIIYFSAIQKLKVAPYHFICYNNEDCKNDGADDIDDIQTYDERKKAGVACVRKILSRSKKFSGTPVSPHTPSSPSTPKLFTIYNPYIMEKDKDGLASVGNTVVNKYDWLEWFEKHSKKDDLADSFLQGLSYIVKSHDVSNKQ